MLPFPVAWLLTLLLILLHADGSAAGFSWHSHKEVPVAAATDIAEAGVVVTDRMQDAMELVTTIRDQKSSCKRVAGTRLIHFCASYNGVKSGEASDVMLDRAQELFAVRMTQCTLEDALQQLKPSCRPLLESNIRPDTTARQLQLCKDAMYNDPSAWTTFEQLKSNAFTMCQAMRHEVQKDEQIELFLAMFDAFSGLNSTMKQHKASFEDVRTQFSDLRGAMQALHQDMRQKNEAVLATVTNSFKGLEHDFSTMAADVGAFRQSQAQANRDLQNFMSQVNQAFEDAKVYGTQMDEQYETGLVRLHDNVKAVQNKYQFELEMSLATTHQTVYALSNSLEDANHVVSHLLNNLGMVDHGLISSAGKLQGFDNQLEATTKKQQRFNQHFDDLQSAVNATKEKMVLMEALAEQTSRSLDTFAFLMGWATQLWKAARQIGLAFLVYFVVAICVVSCIVPSSVVFVPKGVIALLLAVYLTYRFPGLFSAIDDILDPTQFIPTRLLEVNAEAIYIFLGGLVVGIMITRLLQRYHPARYDPSAPRLNYPIPEDFETIEDGKPRISRYHV